MPVGRAPSYQGKRRLRSAPCSYRPMKRARWPMRLRPPSPIRWPHHAAGRVASADDEHSVEITEIPSPSFGKTVLWSLYPFGGAARPHGLKISRSV